MRPGKIILLVVGVFAVLAGLGLAAGGTVLVWAHATQRDDTGYYMTPSRAFVSDSYAITSEEIDLRYDLDVEGLGWLPDVGQVRIEVTGAEEGAVFVGIGPEADVEAYLRNVSHDEVTAIEADPFRVDYRRSPGTQTPSVPTEESFWVAKVSGTGTQSLTVDVESGRWAAVVMNADGSQGVEARAAAGIRTSVLLPIGITLLAVGFVLALVGSIMMMLALRNSSRGAGGSGSAGGEAVPSEPVAPQPARARGAGPGTPPSGGSTAYPVRLTGRLDTDLSRWLWIVKWILAIPHFFVLAILWWVFALLTVVAGFAILFTGRYPPSIFAFNAGVLRWTWRVAFYALTLGTDRYPPFSLDPDPDYPADLEVDYPERLSRGLVLVKWWLLAIPHYIILSVFGGGLMVWTYDWTGDNPVQTVLSIGLIGILVFVAAVVLLFTRAYPRQVFDLVMGMQRWTYRVLGYAALMRDEYPPFRLDTGGTDPGTTTPPPARPRTEPTTGAATR